MAGSTPASPTVDAARAAGAPAAARHVSPWREAWRRFRRHRLAVVSAVVLLLMIVAVVLGPLLWHVPINDIDFAAHLQGPRWTHPLGTDDLGQDLLARMLLWRPHLAGGRPGGDVGRRSSSAR